MIPCVKALVLSMHIQIPPLSKEVVTAMACRRLNTNAAEFGARRIEAIATSVCCSAALAGELRRTATTLARRRLRYLALFRRSRRGVADRRRRGAHSRQIPNDSIHPNRDSSKILKVHLIHSVLRRVVI